jgi:hypothetical protein
VLTKLAAGVVAATATVALAAPAQAIPHIQIEYTLCSILDASPTLTTLTNTIQAFHAQGYTSEEVGLAMFNAMTSTCKQHGELLWSYKGKS